MACLDLGVRPAAFPGGALLTTSSGLMKLNRRLIGAIMMSREVRVRLGEPGVKQAAASCQQHVTGPGNVAPVSRVMKGEDPLS